MGMLRNEYHLFLKDLLANDHYKVNCTYAVMTANSAALATIYSGKDDSSAASNPATTTDTKGEIRFYMASSINSVDVTIYTANGEAIFIKGVTPSTHGVWIDRQKLKQELVIPLVYNSNVETTTGFTPVSPCLIEDIDLVVETLDATETIDVGFNGSTTNDPNGLIAAASIATAGWVALQGVVNNGSNIDYVDAVKLGVLLASFINGSDAVVSQGGIVRKKTHIGAAETDANITYTCSAGSDTFVGWIIVHLTKTLS